MRRTCRLTTRSTGPLAGGAGAPSARGRLAWFVRPTPYPPMRTLVIPPAAQRDEDSVQMLSAWIAENGLLAKHWDVEHRREAGSCRVGHPSR
ncbi:MAG: DUF5076 domain-containing protein [Betaproteobacteria bacterium]|nr:MAG: DUF5076 domain-containing protein [Betaproteobacteria bacterium]